MLSKKNQKVITGVLVGILLTSICNAQTAADLDVVEKRMVLDLLNSNDEIENAKESTGDLLSMLRSDGTWTDVYYKDRSDASWEPRIHLQRMLKMSQAYRKPSHPLHKDMTLRSGILSAYDYWTGNALIESENWWWNEIGAPRLLGRTMVLMKSELSASQIKDGDRILQKGALGQTGQNLIWRADITAMRGVMADSPRIVETAFDAAASVIRIADGTAEGIKSDFSFHQHGPQLYSGGYGYWFSEDVSRLVSLAHDTGFAFDRSEVNLLTDYFLNGLQWMMRGGTLDYSVQGREIARMNASEKAAGMRIAALSLLNANPTRKAELEVFADRLNDHSVDPTKTVIGNRHFWKSDYMVHQRPGFMASVRMDSRRTIHTEMVNRENLQGLYLGRGATMIYRTGQEYRDIFPVWNWRQIPGVTIEQGPCAPPAMPSGYGSKDFVGGVSSGEHGLAAMEFAAAKVTARKSWFFLGDRVVALGADIDAPAACNPVYTTLNQSLRDGIVTAMDAVGQRTLANGTHRLHDAQWIHHDNTGYLFLESPSSAVVRLSRQRGSWHEINARYNTRPISKEVFTAFVDHGSNPVNDTYAYIVAPEVESAEMAGLAANQEISILRNDSSVQAVKDTMNDIVGATFFEQGTLQLEKGLFVKVDQPILMLIEKTGAGLDFVLSNPKNEAQRVNLVVNQHLTLDSASWNPGTGLTSLSINLPDGNWAGSSIRALEYCAESAK